MTPIDSTNDLVPASAHGDAAELRAGTAAIGFVGAGAVGTALLRALRAAGHPVMAAWSRHMPPNLPDGVVAASEAQQVVDGTGVVFITVPDGAIASTASAIHWRPGQIVAHCSGSSGPELLASAAAQGARTAALHPLYSFPRGRQTTIPAGISFGYTGSDELRPYFAGLVDSLRGRLIDLSAGSRPLYHAAAIIACNYAVTLAAVAVSLLESIGIERDAGLAALLPLINGTVDNLATVGLPAALTGPVVRGDIGTVVGHQLALRGTPFAAVYDVLMKSTATLALQREDLPDDARRRVLQLLRRSEERSNPDSAVAPWHVTA